MHIISVVTDILYSAQILLENSVFCRQNACVKNLLFCSKFCRQILSKPSFVTRSKGLWKNPTGHWELGSSWPTHQKLKVYFSESTSIFYLLSVTKFEFLKRFICRYKSLIITSASKDSKQNPAFLFFFFTSIRLFQPLPQCERKSRSMFKSNLYGGKVDDFPISPIPSMFDTTGNFCYRKVLFP